jgi:hypothetical protein
MAELGHSLTEVELEETRRARANARGHVETIIALSSA